MDTNANIQRIFDNGAAMFIKLSAQMNEQTSAYDFEESYRKLMDTLSHDLYQVIIGEKNIPKNDRMQLLTSVGEITMRKSHPLAVAPGGFKISPYLQQQMCRAGVKMTFEEGAEELNELLGIEVNAKQLERLCHHYGEELDSVDWREIYKDSRQLRIPFNRQLYVMMDGSMLLTREKKQSWKEVKLCRMFFDTDRVEGISKKRNQLLCSRYVAHLGGHEEFLDKVLDVIPSTEKPVFIADGAKWIWNWVDEYYPHSTQILDFFHCKEHLCLFAGKYFPENQASPWVEQSIEKLKAGQVEELLCAIEQLPTKNKLLGKERDKLLTYLKNNKKRINYGKFIEEGLLLGSGAIESANRDVIQKRMKLSGQRWTMQGAKQMINLRTCHKSGKQSLIKKIIAEYKKVS
jgi:hypothetical protein